MQHDPIAIKIDDLVRLINEDSDDFDVTHAFGLDIEDHTSFVDVWRYAKEVAAWIDEHEDEYAVVSWPEHVSIPRYNSDANYCLVGTRGMVQSDYHGIRFFNEWPE